MIFASPPRAASEAIARLAQETPERRQLRLSVRELWDSAQMLPVGVARDAMRREAARLAEVAEPQLEATLATLEADVRTVMRFHRSRLWAAGMGAIILGALSVLIVTAVQRASDGVDLAAGKPFTLSSSIGECHPDKNECGGVPTKILFHTQETANPWYQVDLGAPTDFSAVSVRNRTDMGEQRALPLVVEVSDDGVTFREVARKSDAFFTWRAEFPKQHARYVRLRVDRITWFHLEAVKVHP